MQFMYSTNCFACLGLGSGVRCAFPFIELFIPFVERDEVIDVERAVIPTFASILHPL